jgi:hypothetical protein
MNHGFIRGVLNLLLLVGLVRPAVSQTLVPGVDYVQGELLATFSEPFMPGETQVSLENQRFGVAELDSLLLLHRCSGVQKFLPTYGKAKSPEARALERMFLISWDDDTDAQVLQQALLQLPCFERVSLNTLLVREYGSLRQRMPGQGTLFGEQWNFHDSTNDSADVDAPEAWAITGGSPDVVIVIHDSGVMVDTVTEDTCWKLHADFNYYRTVEDSSPELCLNGADLDSIDSPNDPDDREDNVIGSNWAPYYSFETDPEKIRFWKFVPHDWVLPGGVFEEPTSMDCDRTYGHGTSIASLAAGRFSNGEGGPDIVGMAHDCKVYFVRAGGTGILTKLSDEIFALEHAAVYGDVINMSWGFSSWPGNELRNAVVFAADDSNCVLISITHNNDLPIGSKVRWPARWNDKVLSVGAMSRDLSLAPYSNYMSDSLKVDVVAPVRGYQVDGVLADSHTPCGYMELCPCSQTETTALSGGTSSAAPQAAGIAALIRSIFRDLPQDSVRTRIKRGAEFYWDSDPLGPNKFGYGKINAYRSITEWGRVATDHLTHVAHWGGQQPGSPDTLYVSGDLFIEQGDTLVLDKGTVIRVAPEPIEHAEGSGTDSTRVEIIVRGTLRTGTAGAGPIVFESFAPPPAGDTDWAGIRFESTSENNDLDGVIIKHAKIAIENYAPVTLSNSTIDSCETGIEAHAGISSTGEVTIKNAEQGVKNFADITLDGFTISDCIEGIESHSDITVQNSTLASHSSYGVQVLSGHATLDNVTIEDCGIGIDVSASPAAVAAVTCRNNSVIRDVEFHGISASASNDTVRVTETTIEKGANGLSLILGAWAKLEGCTIKNNDTGVLAIATDQVEVTDCLVDSNTTSGIYCVGGADITVTDNTISHSSAGVFCLNNSHATVADNNWVKNNSIGIKCDGGSSPLVRRNKISDNAVGISAINDAAPNVGVSCEDSCEVGGCETEGANEIASNSFHDIVNLSPSVTITAECNYWGPSGPKASKFSGAVDYDPYRDTDPLPNLIASRPPDDPGGDGEKRPIYPAAYDLSYSYPNPFNPLTTIRYDVPEPEGVVTLAIYNVRGEALRTLVDGEKPAGSHTARWDGRDDRGVAAASGVYFVRMTAGDFKKTQKLVLTK